MIKRFRALLPMTAISALCVAGLTQTAMSQDADPAPAEEEEQILDTVTVTGEQNDDAMAAFRAGDFATAEVAFLDNAMCALRLERNQIASIENIQTNQTRSDIADAAQASSASGATAGSATAGNTSAAPTLNSVSSSSSYDDNQRRERSCENRGFQMYMAGLSQIQLGKTNDALENFERATVMSKTLYDAHYKIGLIKLLQGDNNAAEKQLAKVEGILKRCLDCNVRQEIIDRRDHLAKALSGEISLQ